MYRKLKLLELKISPRALFGESAPCTGVGPGSIRCVQAGKTQSCKNGSQEQCVGEEH